MIKHELVLSRREFITPHRSELHIITEKPGRINARLRSVCCVWILQQPFTVHMNTNFAKSVHSK